ncbi:MAG: amidase [Gammaproteobacteria bacterium]|nr:amidase [Gammaproteobacteria bacterium]
MTPKWWRGCARPAPWWWACPPPTAPVSVCAHPKSGIPMSLPLTVGGSSGGSAVAVRAGFAAAALGTDTGGSVRIPAACCGVAGLKPSFGRVPVAGVRPLAPSLDHVGLLAPSLRDLATWQPLIDPILAGEPPASPRAPARIGVDRNYYADADPEVRDAVEQALQSAAAAGAEVRDVRLPDPDGVQPVHMVLFAVEAAAAYRETFTGPTAELPQTIQKVLAYGAEIPHDEYQRQSRARDDLRARVDAALDEVDLLMLPTLPLAPPARDAGRITLAGREHAFTAALIRYTMLFNHTGHPVLALPFGRLACGLPASLQLVGPRDRDAVLMAYGRALEESIASAGSAAQRGQS